MAKLCIVYGNGLSSILTEFFTGSRAYHTYWETDNFIYEMALQGVRRDKHKYAGLEVIQFEFDKVTEPYLEDQLTRELRVYGFIDYCLFAIRPLFHLFGHSTRNQGGIICSEKCNNDLWNCLYITPWKPDEEPPSPAGMETWLKKMNNFRLVSPPVS